MRAPAPLPGYLPPLNPFPNGAPVGGSTVDPQDAIGAVMRAVGQIAYPVAPKPVPGLGGALLAHAATMTPPPVETSADVALPGQAQADASPPTIQPVPIAKVDGQGRLRDLMTQAYRGLPGENAEQLSKRIGALQDLGTKIDALGPITPDEAEAIFHSWYASVMQPEPPTSTFSPEAQAALSEAYGGQIPQAPVAGTTSIDHNELAAAGAFALVNALTGKGHFGDILKGAGMVMGRAQQRQDQTTKELQAQDEMRRQGAIAKFARLNKIQDYNDEQKGYDAKGQRDAQRQIEVQGAITDRQRTADENRFKHDMAGKYFDFLAKGDSARAADVKAYTESALNTKLSDGFAEIAPTAQESLTTAKTTTEGLNQDRLSKIIDGLGLKNDLDSQAFASELQGRIDKGSITSEQLAKIKFEVAHLPDKYRLESFKVHADATSAQTRANAAVIRANHAGQGRAGAMDPLRKQRLDGLKAVVTSQNSNIDNLSQRFSYWSSEAAHLEKHINDAGLIGGDEAKRIPELQQRLAEATANYKKIEKDMQDMRQKSEAAASEIDRLSGVGN